MDFEYQNFYRFITAVFEHALAARREHFKANFVRQGFSDISSFLAFHFHVLFELWKPTSKCQCGYVGSRKGRAILTHAQWNLIFITDVAHSCGYRPRKSLTVEKLDVTLVSCLSTNLLFTNNYYLKIPNIHTFLEQHLHKIIELHLPSSVCTCGWTSKRTGPSVLDNKAFMQMFDSDPTHPCSFKPHCAITALDPPTIDIFVSYLTVIEKEVIEKIRDLRNSVAHETVTKMPDVDFQDKWKELQKSMCILSESVSSSFTKKIILQLETLQSRSLDEQEVNRVIQILSFFKASVEKTLKDVEESQKEMKLSMQTLEKTQDENYKKIMKHLSEEKINRSRENEKTHCKQMTLIATKIVNTFCCILLWLVCIWYAYTLVIHNREANHMSATDLIKLSSWENEKEDGIDIIHETIEDSSIKHAPSEPYLNQTRLQEKIDECLFTKKKNKNKLKLNLGSQACREAQQYVEIELSQNPCMVMEGMELVHVPECLNILISVV